MTTQASNITSRDETPENYRAPGAPSANTDLGPSTREILGLLRSLETSLAA